ncbi:MAG: hypothetical protein IJJ23_07415 [Clostridia bacterium]|nr:hypothetical protein [Clostridia bacterium]
MIRIGFIDYRLDEWHANNYPAWIRAAAKDLGIDCALSYAWAEECAPEGLLSTAAWCEKFDCAPCDTLEQVCEKADALIVLAPSNPEKHLPYAERVLPFGKPTYIDKTFTPSCEEARRIFELGRKYGAPLFSTSALRFADELKDYANVHSAFVSGSGSSLEEYAIHIIEMIVCLMGEGSRSVCLYGSAEHALCDIDYGGGRRAALVYGANMPYQFDVQPSEGSASEFRAVNSAFFPGLIRAILTFFETKKIPVPEEQTLECMKLRDAILKAAMTPGSRVGV